MFAPPAYPCGENSGQRFQPLLSFKYVCFQDKKHKVHKLRKTFQAGGLSVAADQDPAREEHGHGGPGATPELGGFFAHPEYETQKLPLPLKLQLDLGLDARTHLPLRSAIWWQRQQQYELLCVVNGLML